MKRGRKGKQRRNYKNKSRQIDKGRNISKSMKSIFSE